MFAVKKERFVTTGAVSRAAPGGELFPIKFKLQLDLKLTLLFRSEEDRERVYEHISDARRAE